MAILDYIILPQTVLLNGSIWSWRSCQRSLPTWPRGRSSNKAKSWHQRKSYRWQLPLQYLDRWQTFVQINSQQPIWSTWFPRTWYHKRETYYQTNRLGHFKLERLIHRSFKVTVDPLEVIITSLLGEPPHTTCYHTKSEQVSEEGTIDLLWCLRKDNRSCIINEDNLWGWIPTSRICVRKAETCTYIRSDNSTTWIICSRFSAWNSPNSSRPYWHWVSGSRFTIYSYTKHVTYAKNGYHAGKDFLWDRFQRLVACPVEKSTTSCDYILG